MTNRAELERSWDRTRELLQRAASLLPDELIESDDSGTVSRFRDWLDHNELELALDELEGLGSLNECPPAFWNRLTEAAREMGLEDRVRRYGLSDGAG